MGQPRSPHATIHPWQQQAQPKLGVTPAQRITPSPSPASLLHDNDPPARSSPPAPSGPFIP